MGRGATAARDPKPEAHGRVVILVENLPVPLDRRTWQEARALSEAGWDVTVIGPRGSGTMRCLRDQIDGIEVLRYPQRAASGLAGYLAEYVPSALLTTAWLLWTARRGRISVIHACNPPDLFWPLGVLFRATGTAFVFDQHDANPELSLTKFGSTGIKAQLLHRITLLMERASYRTAALVLAPNDSYAQIARRRGRVPSDCLVVVRNAPDIDRYQRLAQGIDPERWNVGYVGVMGSQDGIEILIDAWRSVVDESDLRSAVLHLVGDGEARAELEAQVARLGLTGNVRFHGYLPPESFVPILARCQFTVSPDPPTPFNDVSTMVKVLDSLVIGRPVVAFDLHETALLAGGGAEIVPVASAAALGEAMIGLLRSPERIRELALCATRRPAELDISWERSSSILVAAYARLIKGDR